jgi:hypothetical protein
MQLQLLFLQMPSGTEGLIGHFSFCLEFAFSQKANLFYWVHYFLPSSALYSSLFMKTMKEG